MTRTPLVIPAVLMVLALSSCDDPVEAVSMDDNRRAEAQNFMVAAAHPLAAQAGRDILATGGSAVDAAVAVAAALTMVEPQASGIGGGAFMVHYQAEKHLLETYDGREVAPASASPDMFMNDDGAPMAWPKAATGGLAVGVPGALRMLEMAHNDHGKLPWADLFKPAIRLAEDGFEVTQRFTRMLANDTEMPGIPGTKDYFYPDGDPLEAGDVMKNPALAKVLHSIADNGADAFYTGAIADTLAADVTNAPVNPRPMTAHDLAAYRAHKRDPVCAHYRDHFVCGMGPPSSGGILIAQILGMLSHFDLPAMAPYSPEAIHLIVEASRLAFADRALYLGDSDFVPVPVEELISPGYLAHRARMIDPKTRMNTAPAGRPGQHVWHFAPEAGSAEKGLSTSHFSIRDGAGNAVSMTATIERAHGAKIMSQGMLLNNELTDFAFRPMKDGMPVANAPAAGKRPRSTMSPTLVFDDADNLVMAIGSPGGSRIAGYTLKTIINVLDWKMDIADAIAAPNVVSTGGPVTLESETDAVKLKVSLEALGHKVRMRRMTSGLHGIHVTKNGMIGAADPRREGVVLGE